MNIDEATPLRLEVALEQFRGGHAISFANVLIQLSRDGVLEVNSYSNFSDPKNISIEMAKAGIEQSKLIATEFFSNHLNFSSLVGSASREYYYCCDYHTGAFAVAEEKNGEFKWLLK